MIQQIPTYRKFLYSQPTLIFSTITTLSSILLLITIVTLSYPFWLIDIGSCAVLVLSRRYKRVKIIARIEIFISYVFPRVPTPYPIYKGYKKNCYHKLSTKRGGGFIIYM